MGFPDEMGGPPESQRRPEEIGPPAESQGRPRTGEVSLHGPSAGSRLTPALERALDWSRAAWDALDPGAGSGRRDAAWAARYIADPPVFNAFGLPVVPIDHPDRDVHYEVALLFRGHFAFRPGPWHDWFNLLSWRMWPRAKAALNLRHNLHYLVQLEARFPGGWRDRLGVRIPRDLWMQTIAMLDEGGCVASKSILREHARLDGRNTWIWTSIPDQEGLNAGLRWFGHAVLEGLQLGRPAPPLRMWVTALPELSDEALARRILTFDPGLEARIAPLLAQLERVEAWYRAAVRFAAGDPFRKPGWSIYSPWEGHVGERPSGSRTSSDRA
jgi:hypothetical protein